MSWRKGSSASIETSGGSGGSRGGSAKGGYPFALALRIRVVQIVCGIAAVVMGSVAAIEERNIVNLSVGVPAGSVTVLAAAWSIHRSVHRSAGGPRGGRWCARALWAGACTLNAALLLLALRTALHRHTRGETHTSDTSLGVAGVMMILSGGTLCAAGMAARVRCVYGPAPSAPPARGTRCPRSTSHTAVSMVPLTSNYGQTNLADINNKSGDNLSSDNEMMEISIVDNKTSPPTSENEELSVNTRSPKQEDGSKDETKADGENVKSGNECDKSVSNGEDKKILQCKDSNENNEVKHMVDKVTFGRLTANGGQHSDDSEPCERIDAKLI